MKSLLLYTDGACSGNPGRGGWAAVAFNSEGIKIAEYTGGFRKTTNNRMEILAVAEGLRLLRGQFPDVKDVTVCSDSAYVVNTVNHGWSRNSNNDLWNKLDEAVALFDEVNLVKVKGHGTDRKNCIADRLAVLASQQCSTAADTVYENENGDVFYQQVNETISAKKPVPVNIQLFNHNCPEKRFIKVTLSNGSTVSITGLYEGYEQYDCTREEAAVTVDIADRFCDWLNGGKL